MPRSHRYGHIGGELPVTLRRSCQEAQDTFTEARERGGGLWRGRSGRQGRLYRPEKKFEKRGDHWIVKDQPAG